MSHIAPLPDDSSAEPRRCQNGVHRNGQCPTCHATVWPHDGASVEAEWSAQLKRPDGPWENVGVGGTTNYATALSDYNDWCRDVGAERMRLVSRTVPAWPSGDLFTRPPASPPTTEDGAAG